MLDKLKPKRVLPTADLEQEVADLKAMVTSLTCELSAVRDEAAGREGDLRFQCEKLMSSLLQSPSDREMELQSQVEKLTDELRAERANQADVARMNWRDGLRWGKRGVEPPTTPRR